MEIGRLCVKIAGRDAGKRCVVIDVLDDTYVLIDGETRRRKCNLKHLEPLNQVTDLKKGADRERVKKALKALGIEMTDTKKKAKTTKPQKKRKIKEKPAAKPAVEKKVETKPKPGVTKETKKPEKGVPKKPAKK